MKKIIAIILSAALLLSFSACANEAPPEPSSGSGITEPLGNPDASEEQIPPASEEDDERVEVSAENYKNAVEIVLADEITVGGKPASENDSVIVGGEIVYYHDAENYPSGKPYGDGGKSDKHTDKEASEHTLLTIVKPGKYFIRGELKGQIAVDLGEGAKNDPDAKVTLIFGGADVICDIAPAVIFYNVYECDPEGKSASAVDTSGAGAVVFAADGSRNNIRGSYVEKIYKDEPGEKKLHKYDAAVYSKMSMNIGYGAENNGIINVEGKREGIGSEKHLTFNGGTINVNSVDDGINTNFDEVSVTAVNAGKLTVKGGLGKEGDGIDSNGWLVINGGNVYASGNGKSADGGIDSDMGIIINGGNVVAFGSKNDNVETSSGKAFVMLNFSETEKAGSVVEFIDEEGKGMKAESDREFRSLVLSGEFIENGKNYKLYVDGVMQEYFSDVPLMDMMQSGMNKITDAPFETFEYDENDIPEEYRKNAREDVPEGLYEWLEEEDDIPEEIRKWIEKESGYSSVKNEKKNEKPKESQVENIKLEEEKDRTVFALSEKTCYFSGIYDSAAATGKTRVSFTVNGESRMEDIFAGDVPGIKFISCGEKIPAEDIQITLEYSGRDESKTYIGKCLLSEGYEKVNALFSGLPAGDYRLTVSVSENNEKFSGSTEFNFDIVS